MFVAGRRCGGSFSAAQLQVLPFEQAQKVCEGRTDFVELEPLGEALSRGGMVVVAAEEGDRSLRTAQCHLATSLSEWLREEQVDGAGRPFGVCKNTDPVSRRHFTKAQIEGVHWAAAL